MVCINRKKGAEESNVIIFIILALAVAGLVIYFSWNFFGTGTRLIDGNDPSVAIALESCRNEIARQPSAYCHSAQSIKIRGGGEMIVSCHYLNTKVRSNALKDVVDKLTDAQKGCGEAAFITQQCGLIKMSGVSDSDLVKIIVNGERCKVSVQESKGDDRRLNGEEELTILTGSYIFGNEVVRVSERENVASVDLMPNKVEFSNIQGIQSVYHCKPSVKVNQVKTSSDCILQK